MQVNMRLQALAEIYTMHSFAPFPNLKVVVKKYILNRLLIFQTTCCKLLAEFWQKFCLNVQSMLLKFAGLVPSRVARKRRRPWMAKEATYLVVKQIIYLKIVCEFPRMDFRAGIFPLGGFFV